MVSADLAPAEYEALAEFRLQIRRFLHFSEEAAVAAGLEAAQHQLLLALKALLLQQNSATVRDLSARLQLRHHSAVGLIDRLAARGFVERVRGEKDRREVYIHLTREGAEVLRRLSIHHRAELRSAGPALVRALNAIITGQGGNSGAVEG